MRIIQYVSNGKMSAGVEIGGHVFSSGYPDTLSLIRDGDRGLERAAHAAERSDPIEIDRLLAPLTNPGKIFGSGANYRSHGDEEPGFEFPDEVAWDFIKLPSAIIGPGDAIVIPPADDVIKRGPGSSAKLGEHGFAVD